MRARYRTRAERSRFRLTHVLLSDALARMPQYQPVRHARAALGVDDVLTARMSCRRRKPGPSLFATSRRSSRGKPGPIRSTWRSPWSDFAITGMSSRWGG